MNPEGPNPSDRPMDATGDRPPGAAQGRPADAAKDRQAEAARPRPTWSSYGWRLLAATAIAVAFVVFAQAIIRRDGGDGKPRLLPGEATHFPPERAVAPPAGAEREPAGEEARDTMRRLLAGVLLAGAEEGQYEHPGNQSAEDRRRFIAERFGLPHAYPEGAVPAEMVPEGAQVLAVFDHPARGDTRMVLVRIREPISQALARFYERYSAGDGWVRESEMPEPASAGGRRAEDRGWLIVFRRGPHYRFVFARERQTADETLAAVYDTGYEAQRPRRAQVADEAKE